jgi:Cys-tRNA(Pro)/Cys-tRNA(Cys) deacylase
MTNNITRFLDAKHIAYQAFELPPEKLGAKEAAEFLGVDLNLIFKSIVITRYGKGKPILAIVPGDKEVDLQKLAKHLGERKVKLPTEKEAEGLTGLLAWGISALALLHKNFQIILDQSALNWQGIYVSGGQRGLILLIAVSDFIKITGAIIYDISASVC